MLDSEVRQLELLSSIDAVRQRVDNWVHQPAEWEPVRRSQLLLQRVSSRVESLRFRMEAPLVVATFGGTGTGKSTLVNALVGEEVTRSGRQRPTTQRPVLITHTQTEPQSLGLPLDEVDVIQRDADILRDIVLLDSPDPDSGEGDGPRGNLDRLRTLLPYCDVLLYVSTQQKYRSARITDELKAAAAGCRILFIQTHADLDTDIREDWQSALAEEYTVPEVFFVDSLKAIKEQQSGRRSSGDMGRLIDLLLNKLGVSERVRVRRANVLELLQAGLTRCQEILVEKKPALDDVGKALVAQQVELNRRMAGRLQEELLGNRRLWERRLLASVIDRWGFSPFSSVLRIYHGLGNLIASSMLFRVRSAAQLAILGTIQGARWLEGRRQEQAADVALQKLGQAGLSDSLLREVELVMRGHLSAAELSSDLLKHHSLNDLRNQAVHVESDFLGSASLLIDEVIQDQSAKNSRWRFRFLYELILTSYVGFVLYRVGKNFFVDSFWYSAPLLSTDFYLAAGLFLLLICGLLILRFTLNLRKGLEGRIRSLTERMVENRLGQGLFPDLEQAIRHSQQQFTELNALEIEVQRLRKQLADFSSLGGKHL